MSISISNKLITYKMTLKKHLYFGIPTDSVCHVLAGVTDVTIVIGDSDRVCPI
jgi:hypothetical protein